MDSGRGEMYGGTGRDICTVGAERRIVGGERRNMGGERRTVGVERRAMGGEKRTVGGEKRTMGGERRTVGEERRTMGGEKRTVGGEKRIVGVERHTGGRGAMERYQGSCPSPIQKFVSLLSRCVDFTRHPVIIPSYFFSTHGPKVSALFLLKLLSKVFF
jgi:hypothetical protein